MRAILSRRSGESWPVRATKLGRPSEFSAALVLFAMLLSGGISDVSANAKQQPVPALLVSAGASRAASKVCAVFWRNKAVAETIAPRRNMVTANRQVVNSRSKMSAIG
jgi:hypothetical protein